MGPSASSFPADPEALLGDDGFVRALARGLLQDVHAADDLAQETRLAALALEPREGGLRGWLSTVARNLASKTLRSEDRRRARERRVARSEGSVPSPAEILEREEARSRVVAAVLALEEPYRATLFLRYFENLEPRAVAARQGVPVETVRTRTRRALATLRDRLDREYGGDRAAWCALLVPLATPPAAPLVSAPASLFPKVLAMSIPMKLGGLVLTLVAAVLLAVHHDRSEPVASAPDFVATAPQVATAEPSESRNEAMTSGPLPDVPARREIASRESSPAVSMSEPFGSLVVRVVWYDGRPASGVRVRVEPMSVSAPALHAIEGSTELEGTFRVERVRAGSALVLVDRGVSKVTKVEAGAMSEVKLEIARGIDVEGVVVDRAGIGVPGAEVWVSRYGGILPDFPVATSGAGGVFRLRSYASQLTIGARAEGHAPSLLSFLTASPGATIVARMVLLGPGGAVEGTVRDPDGDPLADALVVVGSETFRGERVVVDGEGEIFGFRCWTWTRTNEEGRFRLSGVAPGPAPVAVRARGLATWRGEVDVVETRTSTVDARLFDGATLTGRAVDGHGAPVPGVEITIGSTTLLGSSVRSSEDGTFLVEDIEPGTFEVHADGEERGRATATLVAHGDETLSWNAVLDTGLSLSGRIVDEHRRPASGLSVSICAERPEKGGRVEFQSERIDAEGRFAFRNLRAQPYVMEVRAGSMIPLATLHVAPPQGDVLLEVHSARLPSVFIAGTLLGPDRQPATSATLHAYVGGHGAPNFSPGLDGSFELGPYPPGRWFLRARLQGFPAIALGPEELAAGETWDCGTLLFTPGGTLHVRTRTDSSAELSPVLWIIAGELWIDMLERDDGGWRSVPLGPGEYTLVIGGPGVAAGLVPFAILEGRTSELEIELRQGRIVPIRVRALQEQGDLPVLRVARTDGTPVAHAGLEREEDGRYGFDVALGPGSYRAELRTGEIVCAEALIEVPEGTGPLPEIELELR